jgi:hypothetical protein
VDIVRGSIEKELKNALEQLRMEGLIHFMKEKRSPLGIRISQLPLSLKDNILYDGTDPQTCKILSGYLIESSQKPQAI